MKQALAIFKKVYGDDHPNVATLLNNLAGLLRAQSYGLLTVKMAKTWQTARLVKYG